VDCAFCAIVAGRAPASVVYDDDRALAFMTLHPTNPGECLVIPKLHVDQFCDIDDDLTGHVTAIAQRLARRIRDRLAPRRVGWVVSGFGIAHAHLIVVPLHDGHDIVSARHAYIDGDLVKFDERRAGSPTRAELDDLSRRLALTR